MAIRTKLANKPVLDSDDFVTATLTSIEEIEADESEFERESFKFTFESKGTIKNINFVIYTGVTVNPKKYNVNSKLKNYNKLTLMLIRFNLLSESDLKQLDEETVKSKGEKLESLIGSTFKFKLCKSKKSKIGLSQIDIDTLELIESESDED